MFEMARLTVPVIAIVIGEASSGGALAIGVANKVFMLENAVYSILSPEGYSSILSKDLYEMKIIDKIIKEPLGDEEKSFDKICKSLKKEIIKSIIDTKCKTVEEIVEDRYKKFRNMGEFIKI